MSAMLKQGVRGDEVRTLQENLIRLGYDIKADGIFGNDTEFAVRKLQEIFGYSVDGIVGPGTQKLIEQQVGYGWNAKSPDAAERAQKAQA